MNDPQSEPVLEHTLCPESNAQEAPPSATPEPQQTPIEIPVTDDVDPAEIERLKIMAMLTNRPSLNSRVVHGYPILQKRNKRPQRMNPRSERYNMFRYPKSCTRDEMSSQSLKHDRILHPSKAGNTKFVFRETEKQTCTHMDAITQLVCTMKSNECSPLAT
jgi:hypothetical protein